MVGIYLGIRNNKYSLFLYTRATREFSTQHAMSSCGNSVNMASNILFIHSFH